MGDYNIGLRMKYEQQCPDCGQSDFVEDHASGDLVCRVGGWVLCGWVVGGWVGGVGW
jgi:transcription initiation factor TFIIB